MFCFSVYVAFGNIWTFVISLQWYATHDCFPSGTIKVSILHKRWLLGITHSFTTNLTLFDHNYLWISIASTLVFHKISQLRLHRESIYCNTVLNFCKASIVAGNKWFVITFYFFSESIAAWPFSSFLYISLYSYDWWFQCLSDNTPTHSSLLGMVNTVCISYLYFIARTLYSAMLMQFSCLEYNRVLPGLQDMSHYRLIIIISIAVHHWYLSISAD